MTVEAIASGRTITSIDNNILSCQEDLRRNNRRTFSSGSAGLGIDAVLLFDLVNRSLHSHESQTEISVLLMATFLISDVHLNKVQRETVDTFLSFLNDGIGSTDILYILGDLFDLWLGDDDARFPHLPVMDALRKATERGVSIGILRGNHDFLLGRRFQKITGCRLLPDPSVIDLYGKRVLITHGDILCTDDTNYQRYRKKTRNHLYQRIFLSLPMKQRIMRAASIRNVSKEAVRNKPPRIMDVNKNAVERMMLTYGVRYMVHGHTHRSATHEVSLKGKTAIRIVLSDWHGKDAETILAWEKDTFGFSTVIGLP
uniref:UDP-2,3-diacylglucosamine hydrolase n=1 Tax=Candidatus Kentrum sp. TC TaxID=2126339 RepID=A0A450Y929_9GAMM|nr:MAG: UDP-2,3-diacylglucosamine hydrolase [Candidatus Kentron sp. TC]VFK54642.1 MAG: UDP-2,3-diacylglucosamine hydrolase [Candidatus Kentron sp. TC]